MLVLGLGLGLVMQVLVIAAQNAVDYHDLGVATSGTTLFRQIGGSIGVAIFGAVFVNGLASRLQAKLPPGAHVPTSSNPVAVKHLPAPVHHAYVTAVTGALAPVFLMAAGLALLGFLLTWLLKEVPLRTTAQAPDPGAGFHAARDDDPARELERALSVLGRRDHRWERYERFAHHAGIALEPPELWLLARLGERQPLTVSELERQLDLHRLELEEALDGLRRRTLVDGAQGPIVLTTPGRDCYERIVAARRAALEEMLNGWNVTDRPEVRRLVEALARDLVAHMPTAPVATTG
jgi:hypothetical protein